MAGRFRFALVAGVVALALGGCPWGTFDDRSEGRYVVAVHQTNSNDTIAHCVGPSEPVTLAVANCALDVIRYACHADGISGWSIDECNAATEHFYSACKDDNGSPQNCSVSLKQAIIDVRSPGPRECLAFEKRVGMGDSEMWFGADAGGGGFKGCP